MERVVIILHSSDLIGTCDVTGECGTLFAQVQDLEGLGIEGEAVDIIIEHRQGVCAELGKCSLYYGMKDSETPQG